MWYYISLQQFCVFNLWVSITLCTIVLLVKLMRKIFYGWWVVIGAFILLLCTTGSRIYAFPVFFEAMLNDMGWSRAQTAGALSIGLLLSGSLTPIIGMLIHKIGVRKIMVSGSLIACTGYLLLSTVTEIWQFYFFYGVIVAIGSACTSIVPNMTAVEGWFAQKKSTALGIASAGVGAGGAVMAPLAGTLIALYSWQTAFLYLAGIIALVGIPVSFFIMRTPDEKKYSLVEKTQEKITQDNLPGLAGVSLRQAIKIKTFWLISAAAMLWAWSYSTGLIHQVAFAVDIGIEKLVAAGAVGLLSGFSIPARVIFGRLGDILQKKYVFMMGTLLQTMAFIVLMRTTSIGMLYLYAALIGFNLGAVTPILPGLIAEHFGRRHFGTIYGAAFFIQTLGMVIGPIFAGWIFDNSGSYYSAFLTAASLSFASMIAIYFTGKRPAHTPQEIN